MPEPLPYSKPPSIEEAVKEHLDVVHAVNETRVDVAELKAMQGKLLANNLALADAWTVDRLLLGSLSKKLVALEQRVAAVDENLLALCKHLGVTPVKRG